MTKKKSEKGERTYMLVTWQTVLFWKLHLQVTLLSKLVSNWFDFDIQPLATPPHGSAVKSQSVFPNVLPISSNASTEIINLKSKPTPKKTKITYSFSSRSKSVTSYMQRYLRRAAAEWRRKWRLWKSRENMRGKQRRETEATASLDDGGIWM